MRWGWPASWAVQQQHHHHRQQQQQLCRRFQG
jgi:hypothetical protein